MNKSGRTGTKKKSAKETGGRPRIEIRFLNPEHHTIVLKAAKNAGLSINSWLCSRTLKDALNELQLNLLDSIK